MHRERKGIGTTDVDRSAVTPVETGPSKLLQVEKVQGERVHSGITTQPGHRSTLGDGTRDQIVAIYRNLREQIWRLGNRSLVELAAEQGLDGE